MPQQCTQITNPQLQATSALADCDLDDAVSGAHQGQSGVNKQDDGVQGEVPGLEGCHG